MTFRPVDGHFQLKSKIYVSAHNRKKTKNANDMMTKTLKYFHRKPEYKKIAA